LAEIRPPLNLKNTDKSWLAPSRGPEAFDLLFFSTPLGPSAPHLLNHIQAFFDKELHHFLHGSWEANSL
jgi:hypothetical protein